MVIIRHYESMAPVADAALALLERACCGETRPTGGIDERESASKILVQRDRAGADQIKWPR